MQTSLARLSRLGWLRQTAAAIRCRATWRQRSARKFAVIEMCNVASADGTQVGMQALGRAFRADRGLHPLRRRAQARLEVMPDGVEVAKATLIGTDAALSLFVASAPLLSSELVAPLTAVLRKGVPVLGNALAGGLHTVAAACQRLRLQQTLIFVMIHGALTYACGDAFAQVVSSQPPAVAGKKSVVRTMRWQPLRTARAAVAGLAADAIPFYYWGAALQQLPEMPWVRWLLRVARIPERVVPAALVSLKIGLHTVFFQPVTTAWLILVQALLRRDSWADACGLVRRRHACCTTNPRPSVAAAPTLTTIAGAAGLRLRSSWPPPPSPWVASWSTPSLPSPCSRPCATWASSATLSTWP